MLKGFFSVFSFFNVKYRKHQVVSLLAVGRWKVKENHLSRSANLVKLNKSWSSEGNPKLWALRRVRDASHSKAALFFGMTIYITLPRFLLALMSTYVIYSAIFYSYLLLLLLLPFTHKFLKTVCFLVLCSPSICYSLTSAFTFLPTH